MEGPSHHSLDQVTVEIFINKGPDYICGMWTYLIDLWQELNLWPVQYPQSQADHLQILATGCSGDVSRLRSDIVYNSPLEPGDEEVGAFLNNLYQYSQYPYIEKPDRAIGKMYLVLHSGHAVENHSPCATLNIV